MATSAGQSGNRDTGVNPVFVRERDIPRANVTKVSVLEVCLAAERVSGAGTIVGAQRIRFQWRIYPATREARDTLLIRGIVLREMAVKVSDQNQYVLKDTDSGDEKPATKVWIDNVPISVADSEIEHSLVSLNCELRSDIRRERARDVDGQLTRFLTGRRFVFITTPSTPLEKTMKVSFFTASVFHWEQKGQKKTLICSNCLEENHHHSVCENEVVCRVCKQSGHKRGSPECLGEKSEKRDSRAAETPLADPAPSSASSPRPPSPSSTPSSSAEGPARARASRGKPDSASPGGRTSRPVHRQSTLSFGPRDRDRDRSGSVKRPSSALRESDEETDERADKQRRYAENGTPREADDGSGWD